MHVLYSLTIHVYLSDCRMHIVKLTTFQVDIKLMKTTHYTCTLSSKLSNTCQVLLSTTSAVYWQSKHFAYVLKFCTHYIKNKTYKGSF